MGVPSSDRAGIRQTIRALRAANYELDTVWDGEEDVPVSNENEAIEAITAVDDAYLYVQDESGKRSWVRFVLGNDPEEVICDHGESLEPVLDPLIDSWMD
jgi:hypothetical protein